MEPSYSNIAIKYVGSTPAQNAVDVLRELQTEGTVSLRNTVAVTRSAGGEMHYYPVQSITARQIKVAMGLAGFVLGIVFGRRLRCSLLGAGLGTALGALAVTVRHQFVEAAIPYVEKNESMLYMQIASADWSVFWAEMKPYLQQGKMVLCTLAPAHIELERILASEEMWQFSSSEPVTGAVTPELPTESVPRTVVSGDQSASVDELDDLTAIKGIGSIIGSRLREGGIRTFAQLASLDAEEIAHIAGVPASHVVSNDWIGQAEALASLM